MNSVDCEETSIACAKPCFPFVHLYYPDLRDVVNQILRKHSLRYSSFVAGKVPINIKIAMNAIINATYLVNSTIENKALRTNIFVYKLLFIQLDLT